MSYTVYKLWEILALASVAIGLITMIILMCAKFLKNRYYQEFHEDELIKKTKTSNAENKLYFTSGDTFRYIKKYVISETQYDKFVVANYSDLYSKISFFVMCYKNKKKPFRVLEYTEYATLVNGSKLIVIPKETKYVNIIIKSVEGTDINKHAIRPLTKARVSAYAVVSSLHVLGMLFAIRHAIGYIFATKAIFPAFLNSVTDYVIIALIFIVSILSFFIAKGSNNRRNKKNLKEGGVIEYDFA